MEVGLFDLLLSDLRDFAPPPLSKLIRHLRVLTHHSAHEPQKGKLLSRSDSQIGPSFTLWRSYLIDRGEEFGLYIK